jgi:hypothetical protein
MQSKLSFHVYQLQGEVGLGLNRDRNRAKMRGAKPTNPFLSMKITEKVAHLCAVFPNGTAKSASRIWERYETNPGPLMMNKQNS